MNARQQYAMLEKRTRYRGSRKARRAERRIDALVKPFGKLLMRGWREQQVWMLRKLGLVQ